MDKLLEKYSINIKDLLLMSSLDNWTASEIEDLEYIEDRIETHLEDWNPNFEMYF